jgi:hypothetical protein
MRQPLAPSHGRRRNSPAETTRDEANPYGSVNVRFTVVAAPRDLLIADRNTAIEVRRKRGSAIATITCHSAGCKIAQQTLLVPCTIRILHVGLRRRPHN